MWKFTNWKGEEMTTIAELFARGGDIFEKWCKGLDGILWLCISAEIDNSGHVRVIRKVKGEQRSVANAWRKAADLEVCEGGDVRKIFDKLYCLGEIQLCADGCKTNLKGDWDMISVCVKPLLPAPKADNGWQFVPMYTIIPVPKIDVLPEFYQKAKNLLTAEELQWLEEWETRCSLGQGLADFLATPAWKSLLTPLIAAMGSWFKWWKNKWECDKWTLGKFSRTCPLCVIFHSTGNTLFLCRYCILCGLHGCSGWGEAVNAPYNKQPLLSALEKAVCQLAEERKQQSYEDEVDKMVREHCEELVPSAMWICKKAKECDRREPCQHRDVHEYTSFFCKHPCSKGGICEPVNEGEKPAPDEDAVLRELIEATKCEHKYIRTARMAKALEAAEKLLEENLRHPDNIEERLTKSFPKSEPDLPIKEDDGL
jgi:hypothetical protein